VQDSRLRIAKEVTNTSAKGKTRKKKLPLMEVAVFSGGRNKKMSSCKTRKKKTRGERTQTGDGSLVKENGEEGDDQPLKASAETKVRKKQRIERASGIES